MKWFTIAFCAVLFGIVCHAQERMSISLEEAPLNSLVEHIESRSSFRFYFVQEWIDTVNVSVSMNEASVEDILRSALRGRGMYYYITGEQIILTPKVRLSDEITTTVDSRIPASRLTRAGRASTDDSPPQRAVTIKIGKPGSPQRDAYVVTGNIKDHRSGEPLPGAVIRTRDLRHAAVTDAFGFYSLRLPRGEGILVVEFVGMKTLTQKVELVGDGSLHFSMEESVSQLKEVVIESDVDANVSRVQMGVNTIDIRNMKNIPKILGENDVLRVATSLPGVKTIGEGASGLNVRGGHADQNLVLLNEATIYNTSHFLGFFSVFNPDALRSFELYKSGMPVQHGGRLSSTFELLMRDGNSKKFSGQGGVGPITSHLTLEVPVIRDKASVMAGGRTTYSNWVFKLIPESVLKNTRASFSDYFARVSYKPNDKNSIFLSLYGSNDAFNLSTDTLFAYTNSLVSLQWRHMFKGGVDLVVSATNSAYKYSIDYDKRADAAFEMGFAVNESNLKAEVNHPLGRHKLTYGAQARLYDLHPGYISDPGDSSNLQARRLQQERGLESSIFVADDFELTPALTLYAGARYSLFSALGPRAVYRYTDGVSRTDASIIDSVNYGRNSVMQTYSGPEYRVSLRLRINEETALKGSYNRTRQYIHMLSNTVSVSPTDTWKLSDVHTRPQRADQVSVGLYRDLANDVYELSGEVYYKWLDNILDYKTGATLLVNEKIEQAILQGNGKAYGVEVLLRKRLGRLTGWIGYAYSRTWVRLNGVDGTEVVNEGRYFPANYDKPHDVSVVSNYRITRRYSFSFNFAYSTGRPITTPVAAYRFGNSYRVEYSKRNAYRIPDYVRADLSFNIEGNHRVKKLAHAFWSISVYNILGRRNPYSVFFRVEDGEVNGYKLSIFGAPIPTVTYHFKF